MRKLFFIPIFILLFSSCSSDDGNPNDDNNNANNNEYFKATIEGVQKTFNTVNVIDADDRFWITAVHGNEQFSIYIIKNQTEGFNDIMYIKDLVHYSSHQWDDVYIEANVEINNSEQIKATFHGQVQNLESGVIINITDGEFNVKP